MAQRKLSPDTLAIIEVVERAAGAAKSTAEHVATQLALHSEQDEERFAAVAGLVESVAADVRSLLQSRAFVRGAWWAIASMSAVVSAIVGFVVAWIKHS